MSSVHGQQESNCVIATPVGICLKANILIFEAPQFNEHTHQKHERILQPFATKTKFCEQKCCAALIDCQPL